MNTVVSDQKKRELIDQAVRRAQEVLADAKATTQTGVEVLIRTAYETVAPSDMILREPDQIAGPAISMWRLGEHRKRGELQLKVFNPTLKEDGWTSPYTVVQMVNDDMPFLVDSSAVAFESMDLAIQLDVHPVLRAQRNRLGRLLHLAPNENGDGGDDGSVVESYMHFEIDRLAGKRQLQRLHDELHEVLVDVKAAVRDWSQMREKVAETVKELETSPTPLADDEVAEGIAFLNWLDDNHFTFLGYRNHDLIPTDDGRDALKVVHGSSLGVLREEVTEDWEPRALSRKMSRFARLPELLVVTKSDRRSRVHRPGHMDYIGVKRFDAEGNVVGERRFLGLYTSVAYSRSAKTIPLLRRKVTKTLERARFANDGHDGKALLHILETFPRDELFQISDKRLFEIAMGILQLQERKRVALFVRRDPMERFVTCIVFVPRDRFNTEVRLAIQAVLEREFSGKVTAFYTQVADTPLARIHFIVKTTPGRVPQVDLPGVEAQLVRAAQTWDDNLCDALIEADSRGGWRALFKRYEGSFTLAYRDRFDIQTAVFDIGKIEEAVASKRLQMHLFRPPGARSYRMNVKLYHPTGNMALSDVLPLLENMGLKVLSEIPFAVNVGGKKNVWVHDFALETNDSTPIDLDKISDTFPSAFVRTWRRELENDGFNRLVLRAELTWLEVFVLRCYARFLRQAGTAFSQNYMAETLAGNPHLARLLVDLFTTRFDPNRPDDEAGEISELAERIETALDEVSSLDEDRILRQFLSLIRNTLRTNYFQRDADGKRKTYLAIKLASPQIKFLPHPRPAFEVFVYSARTEGVHLRGGKVARGGIRWSDRREDFRTEILGLFQAQMVKNAVIVPVGAKGGFVVKRPPSGGDREAVQAEAIECYKILMRGLLDITDNQVDGEIVPPPDVVRLDDDDSYLVVAADKGTASFSDIANGVAEDYGFWLGDAFASGGSAGYDHKVMGITARGAWEAVKRHFREIGTDIQRKPFTCVGVGDMSGDVFGNGMLLSRQTRLVAAFNHLHIFIDPKPSPRKSFAERQRLFDLPRSTWADYDLSAISKGGGVFERKAKEIALSPQIQKTFGIMESSLAPNQLIQALITAEVDLLWFGGIGTFVKSSTESDAQVGDRANDGVRVDATQLRCQVVGEGANLGVTQRGRIEYALNKGRINTDAIDNSGGVDTSDHEVNIKIPFGELLAAGDLTRAQRDKTLEAMTDEVATLVLRNNYLQTQAISVAQARGFPALDGQARLIRSLERRKRLNRKIESLPDEEMLNERRAKGTGLTRPELAVLLAYAKISLYADLLGSSLLDDPALLDDLLEYFPRRMHKQFREKIEQHSLRSEIIATFATNSMVNRVGPAFVHAITQEVDADSADVTRAYIVAREAFGLRRIWKGIEALDNKVPSDLQIKMILEVNRLIERVVLWLIRECHNPLEISDCIRQLKPAVSALSKSLDSILPGWARHSLHRRIGEFTRRDVPEDLARRLASLATLRAAPDIQRIAQQGSWDAVYVGEVYFGVGSKFRIDWFREKALAIGSSSNWNKQAVDAVVDDIFRHQSALTSKILEAGNEGGAKDAIRAWSDARRSRVRQTRERLTEIRTSGSLDLATLTVASQQLRSLAES